MTNVLFVEPGHEDTFRALVLPVLRTLRPDIQEVTDSASLLSVRLSSPQSPYTTDILVFGLVRERASEIFDAMSKEALERFQLLRLVENGQRYIVESLG